MSPRCSGRKARLKGSPLPIGRSASLPGGANRFRDDGLPPAGAGSADSAVGQGSPARRPQECRREPRRSRRRRAGGRVPLEDERHRRRHHPDAARRREGSGRELRRARGRQRCAELLRRRQPDAAAARSAGRQLGRDRPDDPRVPGIDPGAALCRRARRRRAGRPDARRRLRDRAARRPRAGGGGKLHRTRRGRASA